ncbi:MAG: DUF3179 domain-containing protein, partial [Chloroflexi bacterium]|nr:DUF3179 domain-containing protein [Chloroflexota bacterium]
LKPSIMNRWTALAAGLLTLAAACGGSGPTGAPAQPEDAAPATASIQSTAENPKPAAIVPEGSSAVPRTIPDLDRSIHSVPLEDILFDTFGRTRARFVPLSEISDELQTDLRDAIIPVDLPAYGGVDALPWLADDDLVLGYESDGEAFAYPINILNFHEIVNDTIGGVPLLITYCPLCFSGVVFSREVDGQTLTFGNTSALYQSDLVMYDHQTGSYWFQVAGEAVVGTLTGSRLKPLPSATMPWGAWKALHPDTLLITGAQGGRETIFAGSRYGSGFGSGYQDRINKGQFIFPVDEDKLDGRLAAGEIVLTVETGGGITAFPLGVIGDGAVNAVVGGEAIVVFTTSGGRSVGAFSRTIEGPTGGRTLTFDYQEDERFTDRETGSTWDFAGRAGDGPLAGSRLERVSTRRSLWFAVAIAFPDIDIHSP